MRTALTALVLVVLAAIAAGQQPAAPLTGAIDIHVHSLPDDRPRSLDGFEAAR